MNRSERFPQFQASSAKKIPAKERESSCAMRGLILMDRPCRCRKAMSALPGEIRHRRGTKACPPPIREAAFASLKAPLRPVPAQVDPTDASEGREASGR